MSPKLLKIPIAFGRRKTEFLNLGKTVKSDEKVGYLENVFFDEEFDKIGYGYRGPLFFPFWPKTVKSTPLF